jgi:hypothetical protein
MTVNNPQLDATNKLRTSNPQALIDTDFEYGTQVSKWENLTTTNLRPYAYTTGIPIQGTISAMSTTAGSRVVTVTGSGFNFSAASYGLPIVVQDTLNPIANGTFTIDTSSVPSTTNFSYLARAAATVTTTGAGILDANKTAISAGTYYTNAAIGGTPTMTYSGAKITVTTTVPHGLSIGNEIQVAGTTASSGAPNGSWVVAQISSPTTFYFYSTVAPTGSISGGSVYVRPQGAILHRPFDGGVIFSSNGSSNYEATTRQTRRYFRYQSGKSIQFSSGTILKPNLQLDSISYATSGNLVTVVTKDQHNIQPGSVITISGANEPLFNGSFSVYNITGYNSFTYTPTITSASNITASGLYYVSITGWYGALNRLGIFDQQNGMFFEFDGQQMYVVRRTSTYQLSGRVSINAGATTVTATSGFNTAFAKQLIIGDFIVIRGVSYRVDDIASDTQLTISPAFRGTTNITGAIVSKTTDVRIPQSDWNLDTMDGTGPSGYNMDLSRMQMFYIDYSWYGAGFIRWGLRGTDGDVTYVHKLQNNNVNFEAYMRSGNLPGRYETITLPPRTALNASVAAIDNAITVLSTAGFPNSGTIVIKGSSAYEYINYSNKTATSFTGLTREKAGVTTTSITAAAVGSNVITLSAASAGIQVGQRVISNTANSSYPDGTFVSTISADGLTITLTQALTGSASSASITFVPMGSGSGQAYTYSTTDVIGVELAFPTYAPTISHWGTSVIMDGRFDDDKSLLFTYGQITATNLAPSAGATVTPVTANVGANTNITIPASSNIVVGMAVSAAGGTVTTFTNGCTVTAVVSSTIIQLSSAVNVVGTTLTFSGAAQKALFSIRVAPSVDNGRPGAFGTRELVNRMQLVLRALDIALQGSTIGNLLVTAVLNGTPSTAGAWAPLQSPSSSLAQIVDHSTSGSTTIAANTGEITGGFFVNSTNSIDLSIVRDLGNAILGGGTASANTGVYPDGPDVLTIVVQNLSATSPASVVGRLSWTEAQA